jgi:hypothetical protein
VVEEQALADTGGSGDVHGSGMAETLSRDDLASRCQQILAP